MRYLLLLPALAAIVCVTAFAATSSGSADHTRAYAAAADPSRVLVQFRGQTTAAEQHAIELASGTRFADTLDGQTQALSVTGGQTVQGALTILRRQPGVRRADPDFRVHASDFIPNDPGFGGARGWQRVQWNFAGPWSVNAPAAWDIARHTSGPGGRGATVAVIDSGVAFENRGRFRRDPDLYAGAFVAPYDFIAHNRHPDDQDGHGTHVASTIAEKTNNGVGLTGLAYDTKIMPLRVLDSNGNGDGSAIAQAIRYAVRHHADVINMSVEFDSNLRAADIPSVISALDYASSKGVVLVAAAGNEGAAKLTYPARDPNVISVGATTSDGCAAAYSNWGDGLTLVAPGGGQDAALTDPNCHPGRPGRRIYQETFAHSPDRFSLVGFEGTSFATPHVSAAAALLIATGRLGPHPTPQAVRQRLMSTARDLGPPGYDAHYGAGLLDIAAALRP